jgi:hypothetical protein
MRFLGYIPFRSPFESFTVNIATQPIETMCAPDKAAPTEVRDSLSMSKPPSASNDRLASNVKSYGHNFTALHIFFLLVFGVAFGGLLVAFTWVFPFLMFREATLKTYQYAAYEYVADISHFDNTIWTYGTDYAIALAMMVQVFYLTSKGGRKDSVLAWRSQGLLTCYACSVLIGGLCHQNYTTCDSRLTWHFRLLWTICTGCVTAASGFMGAIATELVRQDQQLGLAFLPALPGWFWTGYGTCTTIAAVLGYFSCQRPACDIFFAGITQAPSTFYLMTILARGLPTFSLKRWMRLQGLVAFIMMAPLLPFYPVVVQYTDLSLGTVNALLHAWLLVAWTTQGTTLSRIGTALRLAEGPPAPSVPVKGKVE